MALPFLNDNLINLYSDVLSRQETTPQGFNEDNPFRIPQERLLSDSNIYTNPDTIDVPVEATQDGIASVNTDLPMYRQEGNNRFLQYSGSPYSSEPIDLANNFLAATQQRRENLNNPNKIQELINSGITKIGMDPRRSIDEMIKSGQVDEKNFLGIPSLTGILTQMLPDKYYDMSLEDQVFTQANMGYRGPTVFGKNTGNQDIFGIGIRSGLGNYREAVKESFDNLDDQLSDRIAKKYGATFNPITREFEGPGAEEANRMTKMMRFKYGVQEKQLADKKIFDTQIKKIRERKAAEAEQRQKDLQSIQQRVKQGESLSSIGRDMYTGPGQAFAPRQDTFTQGKTVTLSDGRQYGSPK